MDRYEKSAMEIMKRGDQMIAGKKRRAAMIRRTSFAVSGMSAAILTGVGIWNNAALRNAVDRENPAYSLPEIIPGTSDEPSQTTAPSLTTVHTTRSGSMETVTTAVEAASAQITAVPETQPPIRSTVPPQTSRTMAATDRPGSTGTTVVPGTTVPVPVTTSAVPDTTGKVPVTTSAVPATTGSLPVTTSAVPRTTGEVSVTTSEKHNPSSSPPPSEIVFGDIVYSLSWERVEEESIGEHLWTTPDKEDIFSIAGVPPEKAVAMREYGSEKYYRYINLDYQAPETDTTGDKRSDLYDEKEAYSYDPRNERDRSDDCLASGKRYLSLGKPEQSGLP